MSDDPRRGSTQRQLVEAQLELVEELFRLAEQAHNSSQVTGREEQQRTEWARQRLQRAIKLGAERGSMDSRPATDHHWIVNVLEDIADYAKHNGLPLLYEYLRDTQFLVLEVLSIQDVASTDQEELSDGGGESST